MRALIASCLLFTSSSAFAWRETGHWAVCEIGYRHATQKSKAAIDQILGGAEYAGNCTWPDMVRNTGPWKHSAPWHFADLPDGADYFRLALANPKGDVARAVMMAEDQLRDPAADPTTKKIWLRFLGHFHGDVHQPLHIGRPADAGGNKIEVKWYGTPQYDYAEIMKVDPVPAACDGPGQSIETHTGECVVKKSEVKNISLHKVWDLHIVEHHIKTAGLTAEPGDSEYLHKAYATNVTRPLSAAERRALVYTLPTEWMEESRRERVHAYTGAEPGTDLQDEYVTPAIKLANRRMFEAGIRLAATLDRIFDPGADDGIRAAFLEIRRAEVKQRLTP